MLKKCNLIRIVDSKGGLRDDFPSWLFDSGLPFNFTHLGHEMVFIGDQFRFFLIKILYPIFLLFRQHLFLVEVLLQGFDELVFPFR